MTEQADLFPISLGDEIDKIILAMWNAGANLEQIAAACGTTQVRAAHDVNRVLNKRTVGMDFAKFRERSSP
jgi:hypothetical protein